MSAHRSVRFLLAAVAATSIPAALAAQRTFVASTGNDANPCSLTQPCRSLTAALAATSALGEVVVLDSAGYGSFQTTTSVTITAPAGVYAGVTVGQSGAPIAVTSGARLLLRGLTINGQGLGNTGVFASGAGTVLEMERCTVTDFTQSAIDIRTSAIATIRDSAVAGSALGISVSDGASASVERVQVTRNAQAGLSVEVGHAAVADTVFANNARGVSGLPNVIGVARIEIVRSTFTGNTLVAVQIGTHNSGNVDFTLTDSLVSANADGVEVSSNPGSVLALLVNNTIADQLNGSGVAVSGNNTIVGLRGNHIVRNPTGVSWPPGSTVRTLGDNWITDNTTDTSGNAFVPVTPL